MVLFNKKPKKKSSVICFEKQKKICDLQLYTCDGFGGIARVYFKVKRGFAESIKIHLLKKYPKTDQNTELVVPMSFRLIRRLRVSSIKQKTTKNICLI